jgi:hypothetical protein
VVRGGCAAAACWPALDWRIRVAADRCLSAT